jgi:acyl phosphate:glycerol-3-phosphate acyltransferase
MTTLVAAVAAYALGCVSAGYYLVRLVAAEDIRMSGSRAAGATNVGRRLGAGGFAVTLALDCAKGAAAAWTARQAGLDPPAAGLAVVAVVVGHVWPAQLRFRGGKGIAPSLGAFVVYDPRVVIAIAAVFALGYALLRRFMICGLIAYVAAPLILLPLGVPGDVVAAVAAVAAIVLVAHRGDLRAAVASARIRASDRRGTSA